MFERRCLGFIQPVSGNTVVRDGIHLTCANLHLDWYTVHSEEGGVERLVSVRFRNGNEVLKSTDPRLV